MHSDYCQSVLDAADSLGCLSQAQVVRLLADHGVSFAELNAESDNALLHQWRADALLAWLGY
jgi:hypothetical protein